MASRPTAITDTLPPGAGANATHIAVNDPGATPPYKWVITGLGVTQPTGTGSVDLGPLNARVTAVESALVARGPGNGKLRVFADAAARDAEVARITGLGKSADGMYAATITGSWSQRVGGAWSFSDKATIMALIDHAFGQPSAAAVANLLSVPGRDVPYDQVGAPV